MSIFRSTFSNFVKNQLKLRQNAIQGRSPQAIQQLNSRNAWTRMTSAVDVGGDNGALAKSYILQSGTLNSNNNLKSGIGNSFDNNAYSNTAQDGNPYTRGIRPMPGITSVELKSMTAYGSLRQAVVNFQCWDMKQLEDLELLYMRPGYTVLLEWGWVPYFDNKGNYKSNFTDYYDIINKVSDIQNNQPKIYKALYDKSVNSGGNYDAMYGKVQNYSWSARPDGGYDCQTTIISIGEIIDSLKVNYVAPQSFSGSIDNGLLKNEFTKDNPNPTKWQNYYQENILAGIWAEAWHKLDYAISNQDYPVSSNSIFGNGKSARVVLAALTGDDDLKNMTDGDSRQIYITLEAVFDVLNKYIVPNTTNISSNSSNTPAGVVTFNGKSYASQAAANAAKPSTLLSSTFNTDLLPKELQNKSNNNYDSNLIYLSLDTNTYEDSNSSSTTYTGSLLCNASFLQISTDPTVCLIKNPLWSSSGGNIISTVNTFTSPQLNQDDKIATDIAQKIADSLGFFSNTQQDIVNILDFLINYYNKDDAIILYIVNKKISLFTDYADLEALLKGVLYESEGSLDVIKEIQKILNKIGVTISFKGPFVDVNGEKVEVKTSLDPKSITLNIPSIESNAEAQIAIQQNQKQALADLNNINKSLSIDYFYEGNPGNEIGTIKHIYVNVAYLYKQAKSTTLEGQDPKEKNEINLYNYLKTIIHDIQASIGNLNQFEIHVDPIDNKARIIDVSFVDPVKGTKSFSKNNIYNNLFLLEVHNLKSIVRNYSLQSQIFPEQSNMIAIGAQAKGAAAGTQGIESNTLIDFNRSITDRILPAKIFGNSKNNISQDKDNKSSITLLSSLILLFGQLKNSTPVDSNGTKISINELISKAKNGLRDVIVYYQVLTNSSSANRNLIPTKFSLEMDGIGGIVIGHMFKLPPEVLPKGYRGEIVNNVTIGSQLGQAITNIGHTISNGDWITKIETQNIVLNDSEEADLSKLNFKDFASIVASGANGEKITINKVSDFYKSLPQQPHKSTPINKDDVINYIKKQNYSLAVKRSVYSSFGIESGYGSHAINNNINGMQTDGGVWPYSNYIIGTTTASENATGNLRSFACYNKWEDCIDQVLKIFNDRKQGSGHLEIVPSNPNDSDFFAKGYCTHWISNPSGAKINQVKQYYEGAIKIFI